jgi:hypothetical protein
MQKNNYDSLHIDNDYRNEIGNKNFFMDECIYQFLCSKNYPADLRKPYMDLALKENKTDEEHKEFDDLSNKIYDIRLTVPLSIISFNLKCYFNPGSKCKEICIQCDVLFEIIGELFHVILLTYTSRSLMFCIKSILYAFEINQCESVENILSFLEKKEDRLHSEELITFLDENLNILIDVGHFFLPYPVNYLPYKAWEIVRGDTSCLERHRKPKTSS